MRTWTGGSNNPCSGLTKWPKSACIFASVGRLAMRAPVLSNDCAGPSTYEVLVFCCFAGVRPEDEARALEWRHFDEVDGILTIRPEISKTSRRRFIKLEPNALACLRAYRERGGV